jgi:hypothetical protein
MKVIQLRAEAKDYLDIHKLLSVSVTLEMALGAAQSLYPEFNPAISLKALSYYGDVSRLAPGIQRDLRAAASRIRDLAPVPKRDSSLLPSSGSIARSLETDDSLNSDRPIRWSDLELEP